MFHERRRVRCTGGRLGPAILFGINLLALRHLPAEGGGCLRGLCIDHQTRHAGVQPVDDAHIGVGPAPELPQGGGYAVLAGKPGGLVHYHEGCIFVEYHSLPSSTSALSLSTPAMVLPSLISPLMTIS